MNAIVAWFARNSVAANVLMAILVVGGLVVLPRIKVEVFPEFSADLITVNVPYPGAAPEEVEEGILLQLEEELRGIDDVDRITATAVEGMAAVTIEVGRPPAMPVSKAARTALGMIQAASIMSRLWPWVLV